MSFVFIVISSLTSGREVHVVSSKGHAQSAMVCPCCSTVFVFQVRSVAVISGKCLAGKGSRANNYYSPCSDHLPLPS